MATIVSASPGKRGLPWSDKNKDSLAQFAESGSKVTWLHNWSTKPHLSGLGKEIEWVPLQWNLVDIDKLEELVKNPPAPPSDGDEAGSSSSPLPPAKYVLAFSEPESENQSNITAKDAATAWVKYIEPLRKDGQLKAGSPGISSTEAGIAWMQEFTKLIRAEGSDVDFWALHWYGPANLGLLYDFLWGTHARLGNDKPVWLTEYACTSWDAANPIEKEAVENFCRDSVKYFDTLDWVERYAWNGPSRDPGALGKNAALLDEDGKISDLGKIFRDT